jgi:hypothetical protein
MAKTPSRARGSTEEDLGIRDVGKQKKNRSYVFYGKSGSGKTTIAATFPKPLLLLDCKDEGEDSIADVKGIKVKEVTSAEDIEEIFYYLKENPGKYKSLVIDTMTGLQQIMVEEIANKNNKGGKNPGDWGTMRKQDWGDVASKLKRLIIDLRSLPLECVFIAQDRVFNAGDEAEDDSELAPEVGPRLMPSVASHLNAAVSVIANTFIRIRYVKKKVNGKEKEVRRIEYCLRVGPNPVYITKIRKSRDVPPPEVIVDASFEDIMEVIKGAE